MSYIIEVSGILGLLFCGWMMADLASGLVHWAQDRYGSPRWPLVGGIVRDTIRHHRKPTFMLNKPIVARSYRVFILGTIVFAILLVLQVHLAFVGAFSLGIALSNEIHAAAHVGAKGRQKLPRLLQKFGVIQSSEQHARHHRELKNSYFCTNTNWLNPLLERFRFWRRLEALVRIVVGARPRSDPSVRRRQLRRWPRRKAISA